MMIEDLTSAELSRVSGGVKWDLNTENIDVIDARGGQATIGWLSVTFDINGKVSSLSQDRQQDTMRFFKLLDWLDSKR